MKATILDIEVLKSRADELGITYRSNITAKTLAARIAEAETDAATNDIEPSAEQGAEQGNEPGSPGLDQSRAFATVHGAPGLRYAQDGIYFTTVGTPVKG